MFMIVLYLFTMLFQKLHVMICEDSGFKHFKPAEVAPTGLNWTRLTARSVQQFLPAIIWTCSGMNLIGVNTEHHRSKPIHMICSNLSVCCLSMSRNGYGGISKKLSFYGIICHYSVKLDYLKVETSLWSVC